MRKEERAAITAQPHTVAEGFCSLCTDETTQAERYGDSPKATQHRR